VAGPANTNSTTPPARNAHALARDLIGALSQEKIDKDTISIIVDAAKYLTTRDDRVVVDVLQRVYGHHEYSTGEIRAEYLHRVDRQRQSPYFTAIGSSMSVALGAVAVLIGFAFQRANNLLWLTTMLPIAILMFLVIIYAWLFFSRILVVIEETPMGEIMSFILVFSLVVTPLIIIPMANQALIWWPAVGGIIAAAWGAKCWQLSVSLRRQNKLARENDLPENPMAAIVKDWTKLLAAFSAMYTLLAVLYIQLAWLLNAEKSHLHGFYKSYFFYFPGAPVIIIIAVLIIRQSLPAKGLKFKPYQEKLETQMGEYWLKMKANG